MSSSWVQLVLGALVVLAGPVAAVDFTEDFESFSPGEAEPDQSWYDFRQGDPNGTVNDTVMVIEGNQSFFFDGAVTGDHRERVADFNVERPTQLDEVEFTIQASPSANNTGGSQQVVRVQSRAPVRTMVGFYVFCTDTGNPDGCEFRVRFDHTDSVGQVLINTSANETRFQVRMVVDWVAGEYQLFVNGVDDGVFPFLELPNNVGRLRFSQYRGDIPWRMTFDNWTIRGALNGTSQAAQGDVAEGLQTFAEDIRFDSGGSLFFLGLLIWFVLIAGVVVPLIALGTDNTVLPAVGFFGVLAALWLVFMEFWPDWIGIALIIVAAAIIALMIRRTAFGITDASSGSGLVLGSLGYFVIATSLLAFSGYATDTVTIPTNPNEQQNDEGGNVTGTQQTFVGAVTECIFSGGAFTFGLVGDCSQDTVTTTWKKITDAAGQIYGWVQASVDFVFQLLDFSLPIPTIFNVMIISPPAIGLATYAIGVIRGTGS